LAQDKFHDEAIQTTELLPLLRSLPWGIEGLWALVHTLAMIIMDSHALNYNWHFEKIQIESGNLDSEEH